MKKRGRRSVASGQKETATPLPGIFLPKEIFAGCVTSVDRQTASRLLKEACIRRQDFCAAVVYRDLEKQAKEEA